MNVRLISYLILVATPFFSLTKLTAATPPALEEANRRKILLICEGTEPRTLDPHTSQGVPEHHIIMGLMEGLMENDP
ncbi:MAG TPA: hypothetical protein VN952_11420, partial [Chthoniobacterales bacterium]|nr:hypothetical protein [Chthoniobacterales bacterium]